MDLRQNVLTTTLSELRIRDPFILPDEATGTYILTGTIDRPEGSRPGVSILTSRDLVTWEGPTSIFDVPDDFWGGTLVWAPELHAYHGKYYLFVTFTSDEKLANQWPKWPALVERGTQILVADSPMGPFQPFHNRAHLPADQMTLDGTLWVEDGVPYMIYCHEWVQVWDGAICSIRLADDLSETVGESSVLFHATHAPWTPEGRKGYVTDGPFFYRTSGDKLLMIWSSFSDDGYTTGIAVSQTGTLAGPWVHQPEPLISMGGGHGMICRSFDGTLMLSLHQPNGRSRERARLFELEDTGETIRIKAAR